MKAGYENVLKNMGNKEEGTKEKKKKLFSINSIKHIHEPKTEYEKIQKKLKHANKEIDQLNKMNLLFHLFVIYYNLTFDRKKIQIPNKK